MSKSKVKNSKYNDFDVKDVPLNLKDHIFYGLELDEEQILFRDLIWSNDNDIIFCDSKAGTGKTLIALATANLLYKTGKYDGIVYIVSPTQEEKIGYLPGSAEEKILPYIEPIRSALLKINLIPDRVIKQISIDNEKNGTAFIDCISHVYLRGENFDNKIVILDESQNMYLDEMRKTLTRINDTCKTIVIGHSGQCDIYKNAERSGFNFYIEWFKDQDRAAVCELKTNHRGWVSSHADSIDVDYIYSQLKKKQTNPDTIVTLH